MKMRIFIVVFLLLVVCACLWLQFKRPAEQSLLPAAFGGTNLPSETNQTPVGQNGQAVALPVAGPISGSNLVALIEKRHRQIEEDRQKGLNQWRASINFYGKVEDEKDQPIPGVAIHFVWNDLSDEGSSEAQTLSDSQGLFSLTGKTGKGMSLTITKDGYYTPEKARYATYEYGDPYEHFVPNANDPVIFHLQKKGVAERLIHLGAPMGGPKGFKVPRDGTALEISLTSGSPTPPGQGDLRVQCWTDDQGKKSGEKYDWKCQVSVPNGGLLQSTNEFDFQAPPDDYRSADVIDMPAALGVDWSSHASRKYFLKLANGNYARMSFNMIAGGDHFFQIESFLNPSGSRNLEFDPQMSINAGIK